MTEPTPCDEMETRFVSLWRCVRRHAGHCAGGEECQVHDDAANALQWLQKHMATLAARLASAEGESETWKVSYFPLKEDLREAQTQLATLTTENDRLKAAVEQARQALEEQAGLWELAEPLLRDDSVRVPFLACHQPIERIRTMLAALTPAPGRGHA